MAERFAAKAPQMKGWEVCALLPPGMLGQYLLPCYGSTGIDLTNLSFVPWSKEEYQEPLILRVVADIYDFPTPAMEVAVEAALYDLLGERRVGEQFSYFMIDRLVDYPAKKRTTLINLNELPAHLDMLASKGMVINSNGQLHDA